MCFTGYDTTAGTIFIWSVLCSDIIVYQLLTVVVRSSVESTGTAGSGLRDSPFVQFYSATLDATQQRYSTRDKEGLAVIKAVKGLPSFPMGSQVSHPPFLGSPLTSISAFTTITQQPLMALV